MNWHSPLELGTVPRSERSSSMQTGFPPYRESGSSSLAQAPRSCPIPHLANSFASLPRLTCPRRPLGCFFSGLWLICVMDGSLKCRIRDILGSCKILFDDQQPPVHRDQCGTSDIESSQRQSKTKAHCDGFSP